MNSATESRCRSLVAELGLGRPDDIQSIEPLTGGVASDIARAVLADKVVCIKFSLPKLKVAHNRQAPVHRNKAEYFWLQAASQIATNLALKLFGWSDAQHGFAMEFLLGADVYLWKDALLRGYPQRGEATQVADLLGRVTKWTREIMEN